MNINLMAPINQLGYGVASLNILKSLQKISNVSLHMIGQPQVTTHEDADSVGRAIQLAKTFDPKAPCIKIWHQNQMAERVGSGRFIGFPIFELDTFNELENHHLCQCDGLFTCSNWARDVCLKNLSEWKLKRKHPSDISVIPLGVDMNIFRPTPIPQKDKIIFFNCGKWEIRKGHDVLIEAFKMVAQEHDNVELWMMCSNPFNSEAENARWERLYNHPKVKLIQRAETQNQVYNIMSQVDCGVFPSRGEGWNLELLEMMAVGRHVITTDYAAHTEFCTNKNSSLIPITDKEPAFDGKWFFGQGNWAKITTVEIETLAKLMKDFIKNHDGEISQEGIETARKFNWDKAAHKIIESLEVQ